MLRAWSAGSMTLAHFIIHNMIHIENHRRLQRNFDVVWHGANGVVELYVHLGLNRSWTSTMCWDKKYPPPPKTETVTKVTLNGDWAETMFYNLLSGKLPVKTPRIYFADMNRRTTNFIWIMERVPYGALPWFKKNWKNVREEKIGEEWTNRLSLGLPIQGAPATKKCPSS